MLDAQGLVGNVFSKNAVGPDGPVIETFPIDMDRAIRALYGASWDDKCGLHLAAPPGTQINRNLSFEVMVLCGLSKSMTYGARIRIFGLEFFIVVDNLDGNVVIDAENSIHHPSNITFERGARKHRIVLTWASASIRGVTITHPS
jgi:hypothetical protein